MLRLTKPAIRIGGGLCRANGKVRCMGFLASANDTRTEYLVVATGKGKLTLNGQAHAKARVFVLEDKTCVVVLPDGKDLVWETFAVDTSTYAPASKLLTVNFVGGGSAVLNTSGCGCSMGRVGNAGPADGEYRLTKVRAPEWHTVS